MGDDANVLRELQDSLQRLEARDVEQSALLATMAADLNRVQRVTGMLPANSLAPQARTYQLRTLVTVVASVAAGVAFDKLVALVAALAAHALD